MTAAPSPKIDPDHLVLKTPPRRIIRFKRKLLIGIAAVGAAGLFLVTGLALKKDAAHSGQPAPELLTTDRKTPPDGLAALPTSYAEIKPDIPKLGPPLPGDLGRPIVARQHQLELDPTNAFAPTPAEQAAEAERQRQAAQAQKAREAGVFFRVNGTASSPLPAAVGQGVVNSVSSSSASLAGADAAALDTDPSGQNRKRTFLQEKAGGGIYNPHGLQTPASPWQVMAGSVIAASLISGLNSDLPGTVIAQVTEPVYDSVTGRTLLIPQGARLIGRYDSSISFAQSRALLVWQRIIFPNGASLQIDNLPAADAAGYAGLEDGVDYHSWQLVKGVVLSTLLGVGTELTFGKDESDLTRAIRQSTQQNVNQAGQRITSKNLDIQPTLTVRPGWPLRVIVQRDLVLQPYRD